VSPDVRETLRAEGKVVVFVNYRRARPQGSALGPAEERFVERGGARLCHRYRSIPSALLEIRDPDCLEALEALEDVESVHLDLPGRGALRQSTLAIRAERAHELGLSGAGTVAAVLDTGVDTNHPALAETVIHQHHFLDQVRDVGPGAEDRHGHGTNVAGIIASRGDGAPPGIAPGSRLVVVKVLDNQNRGWVSDWVAGIEHVIDLHRAPNGIRIDAINMSLATDSHHGAGCDGVQGAFFSACARAAELGIALFAASGNEGELDRLPLPACYSPVISVGSIFDTGPDEISDFTSRSPLLDLLAPGETILSAGIGGGTSSFRGTSQAAPHAAAVACLLREIDPSFSPEEIRALLAASGRPHRDPRTGLVFPILDAGAAVDTLLVPRLDDLLCAGEGGEIVATWSALSGVGHFEVAVRREGMLVAEISVGGGEESFRFAALVPGAYEVSVRPVSPEGTVGFEVTCSAALATPPPRFIRGECDGTGATNLSDPLFLLNFLFLAGAAPGCAEACNANADENLNVADATFLLNFLFLGGRAPRAPFPACGAPVAASLACRRGSCD
jgi:hypothetical protein